MLIAIYALLSWMSIFDSGDMNNGVMNVKKEQSIKIMNEDEKIGIVAYRNINNNFPNEDIDNYKLELYYLYNDMEKEKNCGVHSITPRIDYMNESKKNKTWIGGNYINGNQEFLIDVLDNISEPTIGIEYKFNPCIEVLEKKYFKKG